MLEEKFRRSGAYPNLTQIKVNVLLGKNYNNNSLRLATVMQRSPDQGIWGSVQHCISLLDAPTVPNDQDYSFHISAEYVFDKRIWRSWWFEIENDWWEDSGIKDYKYPILNDHMFFYNNNNNVTNMPRRNAMLKM